MSAPPFDRRRNQSSNAARPWWLWATMAVAAVLGFSIVYAQTLSSQIDHAFDARSVETIVTNRPEKPTDGDAGKALNVLLMGSDARDGDNGEIGGHFEGMRNDTTIIMHVAADRSRVDLVSIPRDTQVTISDCTLFDGSTVKGWTGDFNIAFANGGSHGDAAEAAACVINTVEDLTGIYIDHYAVVDFSGFTQMIDALGGVPMCIPAAISSTKAKLDIDAGAQVLDGKTALAYARLRTAETGGVSGSDLQRITRQQELLNQVAAAALSKNLLTDVGDLTGFVRAGAESMTMDPDLADTKYLLGLAYSLSHIERSNIQFATVPWEYTEDRTNVVLLPEAEDTWAQLRGDEPLTAIAEGDASSAWDDGHKDADEASAAPAPSASTDGASASRSNTQALLDDCAS
ncbi:LCP family protein [Demequina oxidasica]|uniref:LCP family protein n=1 Tax=Demequina oxidasica TaxID=676199 RepID=UPI000784B5F7|nr:LCP family protein [Demequina oxidasica]